MYLPQLSISRVATAEMLSHHRFHPVSSATGPRKEPDLAGLDRPSVIWFDCAAHHRNGVGFIEAAMGSKTTVHAHLCLLGSTLLAYAWMGCRNRGGLRDG